MKPSQFNVILMFLSLILAGIHKDSTGEVLWLICSTFYLILSVVSSIIEIKSN